MYAFLNGTFIAGGATCLHFYVVLLYQGSNLYALLYGIPKPGGELVCIFTWYSHRCGFLVIGGQLVISFTWYFHGWATTCMHFDMVVLQLGGNRLRFYPTANRSPQEGCQQWRTPVASMRRQLVIQTCSRQLLEGAVAHDGIFDEQLVLSMPCVCVCVSVWLCVCVCVAVRPGKQANQVTSRLGNWVTSQPLKQSTVRTANQSIFKPS